MLTWFLLAFALMAPLAVYLARELWKRPERQFTLYSAAARWEEALPHARVLARRRADPETRGRRQQNLGMILARTERWDEARSALEEALATQDAAKDPYASLTRERLAILELRRGEVGRARELARAIESGPVALRGKARFIEVAALLVEEKRDAVKELLFATRAELAGSKKPSDMQLLAVLAAADPERAGELGAIVRDRMPAAQRKELAAQLPVLARVL